MSDSHYPPSVVAFLAEQDQIRAHRDRLAADLKWQKDETTRFDKLLEMERFKTERLHVEIDRLSARSETYGRVVHRLVAKVETMVLLMSAQIVEIKDEIERSQFAPPEREKTEEPEPDYHERHQVMEMAEALDNLPPGKLGKIMQTISEQRRPRLNDVVSSVQEIGDDELISAEEIGRLGAGFPTPEELPDTSSAEDWRNQDKVRDGTSQTEVEFVPKPVKRSEPNTTTRSTPHVPSRPEMTVKIRDLGAEMGMEPLYRASQEQLGKVDAAASRTSRTPMPPPPEFTRRS